jgi:hypothetical protein
MASPGFRGISVLAKMPGTALLEGDMRWAGRAWHPVAAFEKAAIPNERWFLSSPSSLGDAAGVRGFASSGTSGS